MAGSDPVRANGHDTRMIRRHGRGMRPWSRPLCRTRPASGNLPARRRTLGEPPAPLHERVRGQRRDAAAGHTNAPDLRIDPGPRLRHLDMRRGRSLATSAGASVARGSVPLRTLTIRTPVPRCQPPVSRCIWPRMRTSHRHRATGHRGGVRRCRRNQPPSPQPAVGEVLAAHTVSGTPRFRAAMSSRHPPSPPFAVSIETRDGIAAANVGMAQFQAAASASPATPS